jgi:hypothetical protein
MRQLQLLCFAEGGHDILIRDTSDRITTAGDTGQECDFIVEIGTRSPLLN